MSRSRRHSPVCSMTTGGFKRGEQGDKRRCNRALRCAVRVGLRKGRDILPLAREVSDSWTWDKDGKTTWWVYPPDMGGYLERLMRK